MRRATLHTNVLVAAIAFACASVQAGDDRGLAVRVVTVDGKVEEGILRSAAIEGDVVLTRPGQGEARWPARDVISITRTIARAQPDALHIEWRLADGDRLIGSVATAVGDRVGISSPALGASLDVELSAVSAVITPAGRVPQRAPAVCALLHAESGLNDRLLLTSGDTLSGIVAAIDADGITLDIESAVKPVPWNQVAAARLIADAAPARRGMRAIMRLADGGVLTASGLRGRAGGPYEIGYRGSDLTVPAGMVSAIEFRGDHLVDLADLAPAGIEEKPLSRLAWGLRRGANANGGELTVGGVTWDRGLGVHAPCVLRYHLGGGYRRLITSFGLDDSSGPLAGVEVSIRVDGDIRQLARVSTGSSAAGPVVIDLSDAQMLELVVESGLNGPIEDRFDWLTPVLVR